MADDYPDYLACKRAAIAGIPVAIFGDFPPEKARAIKNGGIELMPPAGIACAPVLAAPATPQFKQWYLEEKLRGEVQLPSDLIATWMLLADRLDDEKTQECDLHRFLVNSPDALTA